MEKIAMKIKLFFAKKIKSYKGEITQNLVFIEEVVPSGIYIYSSRFDSIAMGFK